MGYPSYGPGNPPPEFDFLEPGTFEVTIAGVAEPILFENVTLELTPHHVLLRRPDGTVCHGWHAERVREFVEWKKKDTDPLPRKTRR